MLSYLIITGAVTLGILVFALAIDSFCDWLEKGQYK